MSKVFGTELRYVRSDSRTSGGGGSSLSGSKPARGPQSGLSWSEREEPALAPTELDALPAEAVIVLAQADTQLRVLAERLNPIPLLPDLPAPPAIRRRPPPRGGRPTGQGTRSAPPPQPTEAAPPTVSPDVESTPTPTAAESPVPLAPHSTDDGGAY